MYHKNDQNIAPLQRKACQEQAKQPKMNKHVQGKWQQRSALKPMGSNLVPHVLDGMEGESNKHEQP